ncbi:aspartyl-phosphate phosphatase Spo0E family protein [Petroclostridium sp. X23]|uniref:aspartyl-phosphate phosphatase Spo0E family protein n=1 Tax=Petroclostridium sp. X23 TaxID=3045146 RepID=UPI0024AD2814|nr:aspartyl-phosphate phosphatase Spo0E family protein [Petroclostridium sp. X23]WHH59315.1 aspartyl-phosphate phosphatase Spo0E family protein [Petroclostridium sp. X23]
MCNHVGKKEEPTEAVLNLDCHSVGDGPSSSAFGELEAMKKSIDQVRQRLHLLITKAHHHLVTQEILRVSRELDELIADYQKAMKNIG